jgi:hypothetical protein
MHTDSDISWTYSRVFAVRARMIAFRADLCDQPHWGPAACTLFDRFEMAFGFFMDAPTMARLARIIAFEAEMADIARRVPDPRWPFRGRD